MAKNCREYEAIALAGFAGLHVTRVTRPREYEAIALAGFAGIDTSDQLFVDSVQSYL